MNKKPKIYIAGPECFQPNGKELAEKAVQLCEKYGFEGISPVLGHPSGDAIDLRSIAPSINISSQPYSNISSHTLFVSIAAGGPAICT